jgi:hypothetical protein
VAFYKTDEVGRIQPAQLIVLPWIRWHRYVPSAVKRSYGICLLQSTGWDESPATITGHPIFLSNTGHLTAQYEVV